MRITFFNLNRITYKGGAEAYITELGNLFLKKNHKVNYIGDFRFILKLFVLGGFLLRTLAFKQMRKIITEIKTLPTSFEAHKGFSIDQLTFSHFLPLSQQRQALRQTIQDSDVVLVKNEFVDMLIFAWCIPKPKKMFSIIFTSLEYEGTQTFRGRVHNFFYKSSSYGNLLKKYDKLIVSNRKDYQLLQTHYRIEEKKIEYIPYSISEIFINAKILPPKIKTGEKNILFVGRLEEQKGIRDLLKIIKYVCKNQTKEKVIFTIAGEGPLRKEVEEITDLFPNVIYKGPVARENMPEIYAASDLVLIPSKWETFCYVALEAQSMGIPVIAYDIAGPNEIIKDRETGSLVKNLDEMLKMLNAFLEEKVKYSVDKEFFINKFSLDSIYNTYSHLVEEKS